MDLKGRQGRVSIARRYAAPLPGLPHGEPPLHPSILFITYSLSDLSEYKHDHLGSCLKHFSDFVRISDRAAEHRKEQPLPV